MLVITMMYIIQQNIITSFCVPARITKDKLRSHIIIGNKRKYNGPTTVRNIAIIRLIIKNFLNMLYTNIAIFQLIKS